MARSLALHAPAGLVQERLDRAGYAQVASTGSTNPVSGDAPAARRIPAHLPSGDRVQFAGWFDNLDEIAAKLGLTSRDPATVYGHAVDRWGDETEVQVIGAYVSVLDRPRLGEVRFARSPITAPPLHIHCGAEFVAAACVPRALLALGLPAEIDERRIAMHLNHSPYDCEGGWYKGIEALQLGTVLTVTRDGSRRHRPYDLGAVPAISTAGDEEIQARVEALLGEAIDKTISGARQPGVLLSGGLDSTLVASHALDWMPAGQRLPGFTFLNELGWSEEVYPTQFPDERPYVEAFAAMNPRIEPHYFDNAGLGFEDGMADLFLLAGVAPASIAMEFPYQTLFAAARERGCDVLLGAGMGNSTFSNAGMRGYVEYFRTGRWGQAWSAMANRTYDPRPVWRRFLSLCALRSLPHPLWKVLVSLRGGTTNPFSPDVGALNPDWPGAAKLQADAAAADPGFAHCFYRSREEETRSYAAQMDADSGDMMQALEQKYGVAYRDVTRYRPLVEFCLGLSVDQYLRDGEHRRLARNMGRGRLPEIVRTERRYGFQLADWHLRIGRRREALLAELRQMDGDADIARLVDTKRLIRSLEQFPDHSSTAPEVWYQYLMAVPSGIATGRFIRFVKGSNG